MAASKPRGDQIRVHEDGEVQVVGIDYGGKLSVIARNEHAIVIKVAACTVWSGRGMDRKYCPPETLVFRIVKDNGKTLDVEPLIAWETGRKK